MRDFEFITDISRVSNKELLEEIIFEAYRGIGALQLDVNRADLEVISKDYKNYLLKTCRFDAYLVTPENFLDEESYKNILLVLDNVEKSCREIKFVNMYDSKNLEHINITYKIIEEFTSRKLGAYLYNLDISKKEEDSINYLQKLKKDFTVSKAGTETVIDDILAFLKKYEKMIKNKDAYTAEHSIAVCYFSTILGLEMGVKKSDLKILSIGAFLHDIGKYDIDTEILTKTKRLNDTEFLQIKNHPMIGKALIDEISFKDLSERENEIIEFIVEQHHEKIDGTGYPRKINGDMIHRLSKIVSLADSFHAMLGRSYQTPKTKDAILEDIKKCTGTQFDEGVVEAFFRIMDKNPALLGLSIYNEKYLKYALDISIDQILKKLEEDDLFGFESASEVTIKRPKIEIKKFEYKRNINLDGFEDLVINAM